MYLNHVFLDTSALVAPQNGEQLIIRDEEETWECISFRIKIVIQRFLALFQTSIDHLQVLEPVFSMAGIQDKRVLRRLHHDLQIKGQDQH